MVNVVADAGALIALALTELLSHLNTILGNVYVPDQVAEETLLDINRPGAQAIKHAFAQGWLIRASVNQSQLLVHLEQVLDAGEAEAICLAIENNYAILIDDKNGRRMAKRHDLVVIGSLSVMIKAKQKNVISAVKPLISKLENHGYYMSGSLKKTVLEEVGENVY